jgi:aminoglycoside 2''-phosphotransferase
MNLARKEHDQQQAYEQRITREFPEIIINSSIMNDEGWDHVVLFINDEIVFRFPRNREYESLLKKEIELLQILKPNLPLKIPEYHYFAKKDSFAGYRMLEGEQLNTQLFSDISPKKSQTIAQQLADFLTAIHKTSQKSLQGCAPDTEAETPHWEYLEILHQKLSSHLNHEEVSLVEQFLERYANILEKSNHTHVLIHNDFGPDHLLWNQVDSSIAVIDFSDRKIGDPACDFALLWHYGEAFVKQVYQNYQGEKDDWMPHRSRLYFERLALHRMQDALEGYPCTFAEGRAHLKHMRNHCQSEWATLKTK